MNAIRLISLLAVATSIAAADSALAGTVSIDQDEGGLVFRAAAGERNDVVVTVVAVAAATERLRPTVSDTGASLTAGPGCAALAPHTVSCERTFTTRVDLGDLDDRVTVLLKGPGDRLVGTIDGGPGADQIVGAGINYRLFGGDGPDAIVSRPTRDRFSPGDLMFGGAGDDRLQGSYANDALDGGGGRDALHGAQGDDILSDGDADGAAGGLAPGPDLLDAGPGADTVSYQLRTTAVMVDISDAAPDGEPGEGDRLTGIESIVGGQGADLLVGNDRRNTLDGQGGADLLRGGRRRDRFWHGGGTIACGPGPDTVYGGTDPAEVDKLRRGCEELSPRSLDTIRARPARRTRRLVGFRILCPAAERFERPQRPCAPVIELREALGEQRLIGRGRLPRSGKPKSRLLVAHLTAIGRKLAARDSGVPVVVTIADYYRPPLTLQWSIVLHVPRQG
jgi:hypothetical protein